MNPPSTQNFLSHSEFVSEVDFLHADEFDFGLEFVFDGAFDDALSFGSYEYGNISIDHSEDEEYEWDDKNGWRRCRRRRSRV